MSIDIYNQQGERIGDFAVPSGFFDVRWNAALVHQVYVAERGNAHKTYAHVKDRSEVRGGGKKPWAQKHTGRSRHGSSRSPLWSGGGVTFGPRNERSHAKGINRKMKQGALRAVLSKKLKEGEIRVVDTLAIATGKTKDAARALTRITGVTRVPSTLIIAGENRTTIQKAARNIPKVVIGGLSHLSLSECLHRRFVIFEKDALTTFVNRARVTDVA
jgi:large subunit ribosomal protein L4